MSLHVHDAALRIVEAFENHAQVQWIGEPELVAKADGRSYAVRDGQWRVVLHGDLRNIEISLKEEA